MKELHESGTIEEWEKWTFPLKNQGETVAIGLQEILELSKKGLDIQRYKGLGEMNPEQLWETTMNPENRTLLRVDIEYNMEAERLFTILMGDAVEPRREYIETHALNVHNLDV